MLFATDSSAHDVGLTKITLTEVTPTQYVIAPWAPGAGVVSMDNILLPEGCRRLSSDATALNFVCPDRGLATDDVLRFRWQREGLLIVARWADRTASTHFFGIENNEITVPVSDLHSGPVSARDLVSRYLVLGIEHILSGVDHVFFVAGLVLLVSSRRALIVTVTAFTFAHSITLALAILGIVNVSPTPIEALIALSIVFLAREILRGTSNGPTLTGKFPWLMALAFGLLHGLGFAGALRETGFLADELGVALLFFNLGVEVGQLFIIAAALICTAVLRPVFAARRTKHLKLVAAYTLGGAACYWTIDRFAPIWHAAVNG
jgi:hypothetical protein